MLLQLQDPNDPNGVYLLEAILEACDGAIQGGAAFAFATPAGAALLMNDHVFIEFAQRGKFTIVVGVDAITNLEALSVIHKYVREAKGVTALAFLNSGSTGLFHPKTCWFQTKRGGTLIVGSGNLTMGGLRNNWEAFGVCECDASGVAQFADTWNDWIDRHSGSLLPLDDPRVQAKASCNNNLVHLVSEDELSLRPKRSRVGEPHSIRTSTAALDVLIAEIPKSGERWNQANFDQDNYENFFGAKVGSQRRIILQHISSDGSLGEIESRPSVQVRSHNYRFELVAGAGLTYPSRGRPIGVFVRVASRSFLYRLLMPNQPLHAELREYLSRTWQGRQDRMRRIRCSLDSLASVAPNLARDIARMPY